MKSLILIVYAYSSFVSNYGPGPELSKQFETKCHCKVNLVNAGDGASMISRLKLEGKKTKADVVVGIDGTLIPIFQKDIGWNTQPVEIDWGPYAFIYNSTKTKEPPTSFEDLLKPQWKGKIILQDPRLSTSGRGFLLWVIKTMGEEPGFEYLKKLKAQVKIISPSWDTAYGIFKKNPDTIVFSYWTSPAYHIQEENNFDYSAADFEKGHYVQREFAAHNPESENSILAKQFIEFITSEKPQLLFPKKNFMYPANSAAGLTPAFKKIGRPRLLEPLSPEDLKKISGWLSRWRALFS